MPFKLSFRRFPDALSAEIDVPGVNGEYFLADPAGKPTDIWRKWNWVSDIDNYPDADFTAFENEHDFDLIDKKGVLCKYKTHILGNTRLPHQKKSYAKPQTFWMFSMGVMHMLNNPKTWRDAHANRFYGGLVVNYVNTVPIEKMFPAELNSEFYTGLIFNAIEKNRNIIPITFSAQYARVFNLTIGRNLPENHQLKVEERVPKITKCVACDALVRHPHNTWVDFDDPAYEDELDIYNKQNRKRAQLDATGEQPAEG